MITVVSPGARTLIEDHGRPGHEHLGVPTSGAADLTSLTLANRLAGNPGLTAALEVALHGPTLTFDTDTTVAYAGTDTDLTLDGLPVPTFHTLTVSAGQTLAVGTLRGGVYGYLAVTGGIDTAPVLGSRSTCTLSGLGPAPLTAGDTLPTGTAPGTPPYLAARNLPVAPKVIRYTPGPHTAMFTTEALARFNTTLWAISPNTSRVGIRLDGTALDAPTESLPSLGMVTGAIQVPPTGSPIVLGPDHGTTGGYPVIGVVIGADLSALAQRVPGTPVRFVPVSSDAAVAAEQDHTVGVAGSVLQLDGICA